MAWRRRRAEGEIRELLDRWWEESKLIAALLQLYSDLRDSVRSGSADPLRRSIKDYIDFAKAFTEEAPDDNVLIEQASVFLAEAVSNKLEGTATSLVSTVQLDDHPIGREGFC